MVTNVSIGGDSRGGKGGGRVGRIRAVIMLAVPVLAGLVLAAGCARVMPIEREMLSEPVMILDSDARERRHEQHWVETLEASTGGYGGAAGGCACY